jgi:sugar phosphate isomerase/epimerase
MAVAEPVLIGTVALDPNRWGLVTGAREATIAASRWLDALDVAGFDGIELWEPHLRDADEAEADALLAHRLRTVILNGYASFEDAAGLTEVASLVERTGAVAVKANTGADPVRLGAEADAAARWLDDLPAGTRLLLECHEGTAIADDHAAAARFLARAGPPDRVQAIVHTHEGADRVRARFDAYGERIAHVHVNQLTDGTAPPLADVDDLGERIALLRTLGFNGSWTIEFVHGVLTDHDRPDRLVEQAIADLAVLRSALAA